jgi:hypothetical protein
MWWGASLFLMTMLVVTETGRIIIGHVVGLTMSRLASQPALAQFVFGLVVLVASLLAIILREGEKERPRTFLVYRMTDGPDGYSEVPVQKKKRAGWFTRFRKFMAALPRGPLKRAAGLAGRSC